MNTTGTTYSLEQYKTDKQLELEAKKKRQQDRAPTRFFGGPEFKYLVSLSGN